jgi:hypothetical protein
MKTITTSGMHLHPRNANSGVLLSKMMMNKYQQRHSNLDPIKYKTNAFNIL